jgi:hypothetical protein
LEVLVWHPNPISTDRRLDNPNDFVRIEIAAALQRDIPVIPILLDGARMPRTSQLPDDLKELASRNGLDVRHASFHDDVEKLIRGSRGQSSPRASPRSKRRLGRQQGESGRPKAVEPLQISRLADHR